MVGVSVAPKPSPPAAPRGRARGAQVPKEAPELKGFVVKNLTTALDYWEIAQGAVFLKDGGVAFGVEVYPEPDAYLSLEDRERIAEAFEGILGLLPEGATLRYYYESQKATLDTVRNYLALKRNPIPVVKRMVRERAKLQIRSALEGKRLRWTARIEVYLPPVVVPASGNLVKDFLYQVTSLLGARRTPTPFTPFYEKELERVLGEVENLRQAIVAQLGSLGLSVRPLRDEEIFTVLYRWLNRDPQTLLTYRPLNEFYTKEELAKRKDVDPPTLRRSWPGRPYGPPPWISSTRSPWARPWGRRRSTWPSTSSTSPLPGPFSGLWGNSWRSCAAPPPLPSPLWWTCTSSAKATSNWGSPGPLPGSSGKAGVGKLPRPAPLPRRVPSCRP